MQATSDHLLDRLRAAAPSPVPGYHPPVPSHSPSPSPSPSHSPTPQHPAQELDLLHHQDDHHHLHHGPPPPRPSSRPTSPAVPARPGAPPPRPGTVPSIVPAPAEPVKSGGFASIFGAPSPTAELDALAMAAEERQQAAAAAQEQPPEEIDLLGLPKPRTKTKNDILKLFEKKEEKEKDLLAGDVFDSPFSAPDSGAQPSADVIGGYPMAPDAPVVVATGAALFGQDGQDAAAQAFNTHQDAYYPAPDAADAVPMYPEIRSPVYVHTSNPISIPDRSGAAGGDHDEEFDAFSSRFESVGREETLMVENDPFDPFSAGGSAKGSSGKIFFFCFFLPFKK